MDEINDVEFYEASKSFAEKEGFPLFDAWHDVIRRFGSRTIHPIGPWRSGLVIDPEEAGGEREYFEEFSGYFGEPLAPIGQDLREFDYVAVGESGAGYFISGRNYKWPTVEMMLDALLANTLDGATQIDIGQE